MMGRLWFLLERRWRGARNRKRMMTTTMMIPMMMRLATMGKRRIWRIGLRFLDIDDLGG